MLLSVATPQTDLNTSYRVLRRIILSPLQYKQIFGVGLRYLTAPRTLVSASQRFQHGGCTAINLLHRVTKVVCHRLSLWGPVYARSVIACASVRAACCHMWRRVKGL